MQKQKFNYITCYRKRGEYIYIYLKNGEKYECEILTTLLRKKYFLSFDNYSNDHLFYKLHIDKYELTSRFPNKYFDGDWPESKTEDDVFILLRELIKESKKKYALETEL